MSRIVPLLGNVPAAIDAYRYIRTLPPLEAKRNAAGVSNHGPLRRYFDDHTTGPGIWKWLHYFPVYERHLSKFIGRPVNIVEVGVFGGGSLFMWLDYFGEQARVYGVDIEEACRQFAAPRIEIFIGDQADPHFWRQFVESVPTIDVVIDDGAHTTPAQITTLTALLPHISPGGVYICEDVQEPFKAFHSFIGILTRMIHRVRGAPNPVQQHIASVHHYPALTVIERPDGPVSSFRSEFRGSLPAGWSAVGKQREMLQSAHSDQDAAKG